MNSGLFWDRWFMLEPLEDLNPAERSTGMRFQQLCKGKDWNLQLAQVCGDLKPGDANQV